MSTKIEDTLNKLAIFGSGQGSNARRIIECFKEWDLYDRIGLLVSNKADSGFPKIAADHQLPIKIIGKNELGSKEFVNELKEKYQIDLIALAGFLRLIPSALTESFPGRIINIHPSLLPKYGGKGMYGSHVHQAVLKNKENASGITIHAIDEEYDKGKILLQAMTNIHENETEETLKKKIQELEHEHFPLILKYLLTTQ